MEDRHNMILNPLPYNIQNPYILKEIQRKNLRELNFVQEPNRSQAYYTEAINNQSQPHIYENRNKSHLE